MDVLQRIKQLLTERDWTIYKLAEMSGVSSKCIYNFYNRNSIPTIETLEKISEAFGLTLSQFFADGERIMLNNEQRELFSEWTKLTEEQRKAVMSIIKSMKG